MSGILPNLPGVVHAGSVERISPVDEGNIGKKLSGQSFRPSDAARKHKRCRPLS